MGYIGIIGTKIKLVSVDGLIPDFIKVRSEFSGVKNADEFDSLS